eukprot:5364254-Pyramimonas_sp.AAC.1
MEFFPPSMAPHDPGVADGCLPSTVCHQGGGSDGLGGATTRGQSSQEEPTTKRAVRRRGLSQHG